MRISIGVANKTVLSHECYVTLCHNLFAAIIARRKIFIRSRFCRILTLKMSQLNINDLPPEMLTKIFRLLDAGTLKNATLACKLWNNLIESGCRWSVSLDYKNYEDYGDYDDDHQYYFRSAPKTNFMLTTKRRFGKIDISGVYLSKDGKICEIFQRQRFNIVELRLYKCFIDSLGALAQLLNLTPNLESLDIELIKIDNVTDVPLDQALPELKKLKILRMSQSAIIECFRNAKLTTIRIDEDLVEDTEPLVDFLSSQPTLTSLTIDAKDNYQPSLSSPSILAQMGELDVQIPFRLAKLGVISLGDLHSSQDQDNLVKFIESQAENLTEVELGRNLSISVYECVFDSMTKLRTLIVSLVFLPSIPGFYDRLKENRSVCTLIILSFGSDYPFLGEILKKLPNIRSVIIPRNWTVKEDKLAVIAQHLGRLESLFMRRIDISIGFVKFANLRTLHILVLTGKINWNEFTKANPGLVELIIKEIYYSRLTSDDIDKITTNVDLQYLRLGFGFKADDRFFEIIRTKCTNLNVLELHRSCVPQGLRNTVITKINVLKNQLPYIDVRMMDKIAAQY